MYEPRDTGSDVCIRIPKNNAVHILRKNIFNLAIRADINLQIFESHNFISFIKYTQEQKLFADNIYEGVFMRANYTR